MNARAALAAAVVAIVVAPPRARAESRPRYGGIVEATLLGAPGSLDPVAARSHGEETAIGLVFDALYRVASTGAAEPALAAALPEQTSPTVVAIELRRGVRFHDGSPLTPDDVAASLERARATDRWLLPDVDAIRANAHGIEIVLHAPAPELALWLALPQTSVTKAGRVPGAKPIGSGPFAIESYDPAHHHLALRAFEDHFAGRPYADQLMLRWYDTSDGEARRFETGAAQVSARGIAAFADAKSAYRARDVEGPTSVLSFLGFGGAHRDVLADRDVRRAIDLAIPRGGLATIGSGERVVPTRAPLPPDAGGAPLDAAGRNEDLVGARAALAAAVPRVGTLVHPRALKLEILVEDTRPDDRELAERVVFALDKLELSATITALPAAAFADRVARGACDLWVGQLALPAADEAMWWSAVQAIGGVRAPHATGTVDHRAELTRFDEQRPIVPLLFRAVRLWYRSDLHGVTFDGLGRPCYADVFVFGTPTKAKP